jgi:hypothetical protein
VGAKSIYCAKSISLSCIANPIMLKKMAFRSFLRLTQCLDVIYGTQTNPGQTNPGHDKPWTQQTTDTTNPRHDKPRTQYKLGYEQGSVCYYKTFITFSRIFSLSCTLIFHFFLQATGT